MIRHHAAVAPRPRVLEPNGLTEPTRPRAGSILGAEGDFVRGGQGEGDKQ